MKNLVIVGGYGNIGMDVARRLRALPENRPVFLAGRNADKARRSAARVGALPLVLDLDDPVAGYEGRHEGGVTAMMAAFASTRVADCAPGVHHLHQVADLDDLAECLTEAGGRLWSHR